MGFFKGLFRKVVYVEELQNILEEEEILLKMWRKEWAKLTYVVEQSGGIACGYEFDQKENAFWRYLWEELVRLNKESQKIIEIWKLAIVEEEKLPEDKKKVLRQLRNHLDWERFSMKVKIGTMDYREHAKIVKQLIGNEIEFWKHLNEEKNRMRTKIQEEEAAIRQIKKTAEKFISKIESNDPNWARGYDAFLDKQGVRSHIYKTMDPMKVRVEEHEEDFLKFMEDTKKTQKEVLKIIASKCGHILNFFKRSKRLLKEIEKRLKTIRPKSRGGPYRSAA